MPPLIGDGAPLTFWRGRPRTAHASGATSGLDPQTTYETFDGSDPGGVTRREFMSLMGASMALAGLAGCAPRLPREEIVPYVHAPEAFVPGRPVYFATAMPLNGFAKGLLVESHLGRPTKVEGNQAHPASLGATDLFAQASVLTLYDPDRSRVVTRNGRTSSWDDFIAMLSPALDAQRHRRGAGLRILTGRVTSPTLASQLRGLLEQYPEARWHQFEPITQDNVRAGSRLAFGEVVQARHAIDRANVILSLESDFLGCSPSSLVDTRHFSRRRRPAGAGDMCRLYVAESTPSLTGTMADHRLRLSPSAVERFAFAVARRVLGRAVDVGDGAAVDPAVAAVADDLRRHAGASLVLVGERQPAAVHALGHLMNDALGNQGRTIEYTDPVEADPVDDVASLRELVADMDRGLVDLLLILGGNPAYSAPRDLAFGDRLARVGLSVHLSLYDDETSSRCGWHVPEAHYLESWSDCRAFDGTTAIVQPLIAPLYEGHTTHEVVAVFAGAPAPSYDLVRTHWRSQLPAADFEARWTRALSDGLVAGTALAPKPVTLRTPLDALAGTRGADPDGRVDVVFRPDATTWDGRFANNAWLQELPDPITKLTWDNAALISPTTARRLDLSNGDVIELRQAGDVLRAPVWLMAGQADDCITLPLGYGRTMGGRVAAGVGFDASVLRRSADPWLTRGVDVRKTAFRQSLVSTQEHFRMEGRDLVRVIQAGTPEPPAALGQGSREPETSDRRPPGAASPESLYPGFVYAGYKWGMAIDLSACTGCSACVVACQSENNIPVVGKEEVARGRELHWLRIDQYFDGDGPNPAVYHQPVTCMQCEQAPCEIVCPVGATTHSDEGLNQMIYNRCVGTRYCSNNCPYKVRRFNFFQYADWETPSLKPLRNPDVTVRSRGVMEKCTYCVQRINAAKIQAEKETRTVRDGEITTACQGACPAEAIVFGDLNDPDSRVAVLHRESRKYDLLADLNTRPRTSYLARLTNPNADLQKDGPGAR